MVSNLRFIDLCDCGLLRRVRLRLTAPLKADRFFKDQEFKSAILAANAAEFISEMPEKERTSVGPRGSNLSDGQRQRIAIARAILRDTPILLLDEPTSALDNESQKKIQNALDSLSKGRTTLIIPHKISTIKNSNKIVVLDSGNVVDQGTHEELLKTCKSYKFQFEMELG